jgi:hypothetical protein
MLRQSVARLQRSLDSPGEQARLPPWPATQLPVRQSWSLRQRAPRSPLSHSPSSDPACTTHSPSRQSLSTRHGAMSIAHASSVSGSAAQATLQFSATMQRWFFPAIQAISDGQVQSGSAHSASGQPSGLKRKPKRAHESSATGGSVASSAAGGVGAALVHAMASTGQATNSRRAQALSRRAWPSEKNGAMARPTIVRERALRKPGAAVCGGSAVTICTATDCGQDFSCASASSVSGSRLSSRRSATISNIRSRLVSDHV